MVEGHRVPVCHSSQWPRRGQEPLSFSWTYKGDSRRPKNKNKAEKSLGVEGGEGTWESGDLLLVMRARRWSAKRSKCGRRGPVWQRGSCKAPKPGCARHPPHTQTRLCTQPPQGRPETAKMGTRGCMKTRLGDTGQSPRKGKCAMKSDGGPTLHGLTQTEGGDRRRTPLAAWCNTPQRLGGRSDALTKPPHARPPGRKPGFHGGRRA